MRFGLVHRVMTDALATLGLFAIATTNQLAPWQVTVGAAVLVHVLVLPQSVRSQPWMRTLSTIGPIALLLLTFPRMLVGGPVLGSAVEFSAGLQLLRLATRTQPVHDRQVLVLALLHVISATALGGGPLPAILALLGLTGLLFVYATDRVARVAT
jgi:protein-glutamine gamma-glutamyltransferase